MNYHIQKHKMDHPNGKCDYCQKTYYQCMDKNGMMTECVIGEEGLTELLKESIVIYNVMKRLKK